MIKKIETIKNMGVFKDFKWDDNVVDKSGQVKPFLPVNIIYGNNYSGKTTLSKIFRSFETGELPEKLHDAEFTLNLSRNTKYSEKEITNELKDIRVFNKDFIKNNLSFLSDPEGKVEAFSVILGEDNTKIDTEIEKIKNKIGKLEDKNGLLYAVNDAKSRLNEIKASLNKLNNDLSEKMSSEAAKIKVSPYCDAPGYTKINLEKEIKETKDQKNLKLVDEEESNLIQSIDQSIKNNIISLNIVNISFQDLLSKSKPLLNRTISNVTIIEELANDDDLRKWVEEGKKLHQDKRKTCAFCGNNLDSELWTKLDSYFSKEVEKLTSDIQDFRSTLLQCIKNLGDIPQINKNELYSEFQSEGETLFNDFKELLNDCKDGLNEIIKALDIRIKNIFKPVELIFSKKNEKYYIDCFSRFTENQLKLNELIKDNNNKSTTLEADKKKYRHRFRLNKVLIASEIIAYDSTLEKIEKTKKEEDLLNKKVLDASKNLKQADDRIKELEKRLKDERAGAKHINNYLNHSFGHENIRLDIKETDSSGKDGVKHEFNLLRNNEPAFNLSDGECTVVAFCYFIAKLFESKEKKYTIWIDDPISSLDNDHIFFIYSLINTQLKFNVNFNQLFISTHNLNFLKYLHRLNYYDIATNKSIGKEYFVLRRKSATTDIKLMPAYLKEYATEFIYLFEQIYICSQIDTGTQNQEDDHKAFYTFGNNIRKFLECYLFFKYPEKEKSEIKLKRFFNDDIASVTIERIYNEFSHFGSQPDRGMDLTEFPEMKKAANYLIEKIKHNDPEQYASLMKSINGS